ncbi:MAG: DUF5009 domain-containing protein [Bacteroidales bacterium]|nr:DUF5009 domain-containing protein [Bacteroidales bacterium]
MGNKTTAEPGRRLASLDALRGFDMLFIIGFASLVVWICKLFPDGENSWLALQMGHVAWDGLRHHDTIFPLFLFIAGVSFPFSYAKMLEKGKKRWKIYWKIVRRGLVLVFFGLLCNGLLKFHWSDLRLWSVLARIGLAWMFAALLFINFKPSVRAVIAVVLLVGYWLLLRFVPAPDAPAGAGPFSFEGNLVGYVDRCLFPGHLYRGDGGVFDPEGLLSTVPAIVTAMLGMFTGEWVRRKDVSENKKVLGMVAAAAMLLAVGLVWSRWFPLNKKLWSSTFVLVVGAYSLAMLALFYWIIDVKGWKKWSFPLAVIGMNSITIYMAPRIIDFRHATDFFLAGLCSYMGPVWAKIVWYIGFLALEWLFLYFLYKKKIFLRV